MKVLDLFSGIGGFSLGLERAGMETIAFCEFDKHAQAVLKKHWPDVPIYDDVRLLDATQYRGTVDVVCGGFPCQDLSNAGKKAGIKGERTGLYREMLRIISESRPGYAIFENVASLLTGESGRWFAQFLYDLAEIGYDAEWHCIPASEIGANHHRDRIWIIAYTDDNGQPAAKIRQGILKRNDSLQKRPESTSISKGLSGKRILTYSKSINERSGNQEPTERQKPKSGKSPGRDKISAYTDMQRCQRLPKIANHLKQQIESMRSIEIVRRRSDIPEPPLCGTNDGIPHRMDRLKRLGNAVVPQIPEIIGRAILAL